MQQQIQLISEDPSLCDIQQIPNHPLLQTIHPEEVQQIPQPVGQNQEIQEIINQYYQQQFESITQDLEVPACQDNREDQSVGIDQGTSKSNDKGVLDHSCSRIEEECRQLQANIRRMKAQLQEKEQQFVESQNQLFTLTRRITDKQQQANSMQKQNHSWLLTKFGKQAFSIPYIIAQDEALIQKLEQKIIQVKQAIELKSNQVQSIVREVTKRSQELPQIQGEQQNMYEQYNKLKRQIDFKVEKASKQDVKIEQMDQKIAQYKEKIDAINIEKYQQIIQADKQDKIIQAKYQNLLKQKQLRLKKASLSSHQLQTNCTSIARTVLQLRKHNQQIQAKIQALAHKNSFIEQDSSKLMEIYNSRRRNVDLQQENNSQLSYKDTAKKTQKTTRNKNLSAFQKTKDLDQSTNCLKVAVNQSYRLKRYLSTAQKEIQIPKNEPQTNQLSACSTQGLQPHFKLRLPSKMAVKPSQKKINLSVQLQQNKKRSTIFSKLSVTQRMQYIDMLEQQDRIQSYKLYPSKRQTVRVSRHNRQNNTTSFLQIKSYSVTQIAQPKKQRFMTPKIKNQKRQQIDSSKGLPIISNEQSILGNKSGLQMPSQTNQGQSSASQSQMSMSNHFLMRRKVFREKKLSQEYMMMLEQRGRKILELDAESQG